MTYGAADPMPDVGRLVAHSGLIGVAFLAWRLRKHENSVTDFLADPSLSGLGQLTGGNKMSASPGWSLGP